MAAVREIVVRMVGELMGLVDGGGGGGVRWGEMMKIGEHSAGTQIKLRGEGWPPIQGPKCEPCAGLASKPFRVQYVLGRSLHSYHGCYTT